MPFHRPIPETKTRPKEPGGLKMYAEAEKLLHIAFVLPSSVVIGWGAGAWADGRFHQHWIAMFGIAFGSVSGLFYVIRQAFLAEKISITEDAAQDGTGKGDSASKP